jgi:SAM-dependent methyltransferase
MLAKEIAKGVLSRIPGLFSVYKRKGTGGSDRAEYCYGVWLKHYCHLAAAGEPAVPARVAELGPGDSLGVGIAALLCGATEYYALDVYRHSSGARNLNILDGLVRLFKERHPLPTDGWPSLDPFVDGQRFPSAYLTPAVMAAALDPDRVRAIRAAVQNLGTICDGICVDYRVPWDRQASIIQDSIDLVLSHSVLEHVDDPAATYAAVRQWLRPRGMFSSQVDLGSHGLASTWNGHFAYGDVTWWLMSGRRFLINRVPASRHVTMLREAGFSVERALLHRRKDGIPAAQMAQRFQGFNDDDLTCDSLFFQARK